MLLPERSHGSPECGQLRQRRGKRYFCRGSQSPAQKPGGWKLRHWRNMSRGEFTCFHNSTFRFARVRQVTIPWSTNANGQLDVLCSSARFDGRTARVAPQCSRCNNDFTYSPYFSVRDGFTTPEIRTPSVSDPANGGKSRKIDLQFARGSPMPQNFPPAFKTARGRK